MARCEFTDPNGTVRRVWRVSQTRLTPDVIRPHLAGGWLTLECPHARRRFPAIPKHWHQLNDEALHRRCAEATIEARHVPRLIE